MREASLRDSPRRLGATRGTAGTMGQSPASPRRTSRRLRTFPPRHRGAHHQSLLATVSAGSRPLACRRAPWRTGASETSLIV